MNFLYRVELVDGVKTKLESTSLFDLAKQIAEHEVLHSIKVDLSKVEKVESLSSKDLMSVECWINLVKNKELK